LPSYTWGMVSKAVSSLIWTLRTSPTQFLSTDLYFLEIDKNLLSVRRSVPELSRNHQHRRHLQNCRIWRKAPKPPNEILIPLYPILHYQITGHDR
jgi:hypothetical protein